MMMIRRPQPPRLRKMKKYSQVLTNKDMEKKWKDVVFRYDGDGDTLDVYFTRVTDNLVVESDGPLDKNEEDVTFDLDGDGAIVSMEFLDASTCFSCHFLDTPQIVGNKQPLCLTCEYNVQSDELIVTFALDTKVSHLQQFYDGVTAARDGHDKIIFLRFSSASTRICKRNS
jgi:uncharacterized protein YuzE